MAAAWGASQALNWWRSERATEAVRTHAQAGDILMFTTNTCPYCEKARQWLNARSVPWTECNIDRDAHCQQLFQSRGAPGVPLLRVNGQWNLGFNPTWVSEALQQRR